MTILREFILKTVGAVVGTGGGTPVSGTTVVANGVSPAPAIPPTWAFTAHGRLARDFINYCGLCGSLQDATADQYAAAMKQTRSSIIRGNYVHNGTSDIAKMQAIRNAQVSAGAIRLALFDVLTMAYINDLMPATAQYPLIVVMITAGIVGFVEGPNEINNLYVGSPDGGPNGGSRAPNGTTKLEGRGVYQANLLAWHTDMVNNLKGPNTALFASRGVRIIGSSLSAGDGSATFPGGIDDYNAAPMSLEGKADFFGYHFYAGFSRQPSFDQGSNTAIGYHGNVFKWARDGFSPNGILQGVLTESGATTMSATYNGYSLDNQSTYIINQRYEALALNAAGWLTYQAFDGNTSDTSGNPESHFGLFQSDKTTPKPVVAVMARMQDMDALGNSFDSIANVNDHLTKPAFIPGVNMNQVALVGLLNPPNGCPAMTAMHKSDGTTSIWICREPSIHQFNGSDLVPSPNTVTLFLPRARKWRVRDPKGTAPLNSGAWTTSDTVSVTLGAYAMNVELDTPPGWTASAGDPADVVLSGSTSFALGRYNTYWARNYGASPPPDRFLVVGPKSGQTLRPGNIVVLICCTDADAQYAMACDTAFATYGPFVESGSPNQKTQVFLCSINNPNQVFKITGTYDAAQVQMYEIPPISAHGVAHSVCTYTGGNYDVGNTITAPLIAVPSGAVGLFSVNLADASGGEVISQSADTSVVVLNQIDTAQNAFAHQGFGGTIAAGRAAGNVTFPATTLNINVGRPPTVISMWFTAGPVLNASNSPPSTGTATAVSGGAGTLTYAT